MSRVGVIESMHRVISFLLVLAASSVAADYDAGLAAYKRGDYATALREFRTLAERGHARAQSDLASMYAMGLGVPEDDRRAALWFREAADQGDAIASVQLGILYDNGEGVAEDNRQAVFWFRKAAEQGHTLAQILLGKKYDNGEGVAEDDHQAVFWFRKAAEQGSAWAQHSLGLMYAYGEGVPKDYVQAYAWFNLAAAQGDEEAEQGRRRSGQFMTAAQVAEAQKLSRELAAWIADGGQEPSPTLGSAPQNEPPEPIGSGSGFLIGRGGWIVTNHHVVDGCAKVTVHHAGKSHDATVRAVDVDDDLALLKPPPEVGGTATFSESPYARLGEEVTVAGYPLHGLLSSELNVTSGNVSALAGPRDAPKWLQITAPVQQGNSGGPLLDGAGNVIGVVVSKLNAVHTAALIGDIPQNINFAIKGTLVRSFLDIHGVAYGRRPSNLKLASERLAELAQTFTVAVHCWK